LAKIDKFHFKLFTPKVYLALSFQRPKNSVPALTVNDIIICRLCQQFSHHGCASEAAFRAEQKQVAIPGWLH
jgi:hypothetical protein